MDTINFLENDTLKIESSSQKGTINVYYVMDVRSDGYVKLVLRDSYENASNKKALCKYIQENRLSQGTIAAMLGVSRPTINRYVNGTRSVTDAMLKQLGINKNMDVLDMDDFKEKLSEVEGLVAKAHKKLEKLIEED